MNNKVTVSHAAPLELREMSVALQQVIQNKTPYVRKRVREKFRLNKDKLGTK